MKATIYIFILSSVLLMSCNSTMAKNAVESKIDDDRIDSLINVINVKFDSNRLLLEKLNNSQIKWEASVFSDLEMIYPEIDKEIYGSLFSTCQKTILEEAILKRIDFLKQWANGLPEGEICSGSIPIKTQFEN